MADREKLKQKYGDEQVLVVPLKEIQALGLDDLEYKPVSVQDGDNYIVALTNKSYYIPRYLSDDNPDEVEIIPYVTLTFGDTLFTYKRTKNGDSRGDGALSIGVGGHINPCDGNPILDGAIREIMEEVGVVRKTRLLNTKGFIRCKSTAYDKDHLGIHFELPNCFVDSVVEKDKMLPLGMMTPKALKELFGDKVENWTRIILDHKGE